jgi:tyrosyl-tRNA synthetase
VTSNGEARRAISQNGVAVNDAKVTDVFAKFTKDDITGEDFIVRRGKKNFRKIVVE